MLFLPSNCLSTQKQIPDAFAVSDLQSHTTAELQRDRAIGLSRSYGIGLSRSYGVSAQKIQVPAPPVHKPPSACTPRTRVRAKPTEPVHLRRPTIPQCSTHSRLPVCSRPASCRESTRPTPRPTAPPTAQPIPEQLPPDSPLKVPVSQEDMEGFAQFRSRGILNRPARPSTAAAAPVSPRPKYRPPRRRVSHTWTEPNPQYDEYKFAEKAVAARSPRVMLGDDDVPRVWTLNHKGKLKLITCMQALSSGATMKPLPNANELCKTKFSNCGNVEVLRMFALLRQFLFLDKVQSSVWRQLWQSVWQSSGQQHGSSSKPRIDHIQLKHILSKYLGLVQTPDVGDKMSQLFFAFPKSRPGDIGMHEFMAGLRMFELGTHIEKAKIFFYMADDDQGGYLSRPELLQAFEEQGTRGASCSSLVNKIFAVAVSEHETVGDGIKMAISLRGFLKAIRGLPQIDSYLGLKKYAIYTP